MKSLLATLRRLSAHVAGDADDLDKDGKWITVHPNGGEPGRKIHLDERGRIDSKGPVSEAIKEKDRAGAKGADRRFQFVGVHSNRKVADAERMERKGLSKEEIYRKTAMFRGLDGQWREHLGTLDESEMTKIKGVLRNGVPDDEDGVMLSKVGDVARNMEDGVLKRLCRRYPKLKDVYLMWQNGEGNPIGDDLATYLHLPKEQADMLGLPAERVVAMGLGGSDRDTAISLAHELQHFIQEEEGWQGGTSVAREMAADPHIGMSEATLRYLGSPGEIEAEAAGRPERIYPWELENATVSRVAALRGEFNTKAMVGLMKRFWGKDAKVEWTDPEQADRQEDNGNDIRLQIYRDEYIKARNFATQGKLGLLDDNAQLNVTERPLEVMRRCFENALGVKIADDCPVKMFGAVFNHGNHHNHAISAAQWAVALRHLDNPAAVIDPHWKSNADESLRFIVPMKDANSNTEYSAIAVAYITDPVKTGRFNNGKPYLSVMTGFGLDSGRIDSGTKAYYIDTGRARELNDLGIRVHQGVGNPHPPAPSSYLTEKDFSDQALGIISNSDTPRQGGIRRSIIGEKAIESEDIEKAKSLESDGKSREEIYDETGLWRGRDGNWRMEIPDLSKDAVKEILDFRNNSRNWGALSKGDGGWWTRFGEIARQQNKTSALSRLIEKYPRLSDVDLYLYNGQKTPNGYRAVTVQIPEDNFDGSGLRKGQCVKILIAKDRPLAAVRKSLAHELQHFIQGEEGWSFGTTSSQQGGTDNPFAANEYLENAGEVEANTVGYRAEYGKKDYPWEIEDYIIGENRRRREEKQNQIMTKSGKVAGWFDRDTGKTTLVKGRATAKTVAHEMGWHFTYRWAEKNHPALFKKLKQYAKEATPGIKQSVQEVYGRGLSEEELLDEVGAERFTREDISPLLNAAEKAAAEGWFDKVEDGIDETRKAFVGAHNKAQPKGLTKKDVDAIAAMDPKTAVTALVQAMVEGRGFTFGKPVGTDAADSGLGELVTTLKRFARHNTRRTV